MLGFGTARAKESTAEELDRDLLLDEIREMMFRVERWREHKGHVDQVISKMETAINEKYARLGRMVGA